MNLKSRFNASVKNPISSEKKLKQSLNLLGYLSVYLSMIFYLLTNQRILPNVGSIDFALALNSILGFPSDYPTYHHERFIFTSVMKILNNYISLELSFRIIFIIVFTAYLVAVQILFDKITLKPWKQLIFIFFCLPIWWATYAQGYLNFQAVVFSLLGLIVLEKVIADKVKILVSALGITFFFLLAYFTHPLMFIFSAIPVGILIFLRNKSQFYSWRSSDLIYFTLYFVITAVILIVITFKFYEKSINQFRKARNGDGLNYIPELDWSNSSLYFLVMIFSLLGLLILLLQHMKKFRLKRFIPVVGSKKKNALNKKVFEKSYLDLKYVISFTCFPVAFLYLYDFFFQGSTKYHLYYLAATLPGLLYSTKFLCLDVFSVFPKQLKDFFKKKLIICFCVIFFTSLFMSSYLVTTKVFSNQKMTVNLNEYESALNQLTRNGELRVENQVVYLESYSENSNSIVYMKKRRFYDYLDDVIAILGKFDSAYKMNNYGETISGKLSINQGEEFYIFGRNSEEIKQVANLLSKRNYRLTSESEEECIESANKSISFCRKSFTGFLTSSTY